jgi:membrane-bound ClpP family serine protease
MEYHVADIMLQPAKLEPITPSEEQKGEWPLSKMLLGTYPFFKAIPNATVQAYQMDFKDRFFSFLLSPVVASLLLLGVMLGVYFELSHPGFGLPGSIAVISLLLIILSSFAFQVGNYLELLMIVMGLAIIIIDLFFLPTFGLLGFFGVLAFLAGLFGLMIPGIENFNYNFDTGKLSGAGVEILMRLGELFGTFLLGLLIIAFISRYVMPKFKPFKKLVLNTDQEGYQAGTLESHFPKIGTHGKAVSPLRPAGMVELEGKIYDAQSEGGFIPKDAEVSLIRIEGSRLFVRSKEIV